MEKTYSDIKTLREKIDEIDDKILDLLCERGKIALEILRLKKSTNLSLYHPEREIEILKRVVDRNKGPFSDEVIKKLFRDIISATLSLQIDIRVSYLGPETSFTNMAALSYFGSFVSFQEKNDICEIFEDVERGRTDYGVVPIENSLEGSVGETLDELLRFPFYICGEVISSIKHCLLSKASNLSEIKKVYSHPQALSQCKNWLRKNLPNAYLFETSSTAKAAMQVVDDRSSAAIGNKLSAEKFGLNVLKEGIEDHSANYTRFLILGKDIPDVTGNDKTSIVITLRDEVGALYRVLEPISKNQINLTKIESRPNRQRPFEYVFYLDMEGHIKDEKLKDLFEELKGKVIFFKFLGSYPRASYE